MADSDHSLPVGEQPPIFRINLSLPPSERYVKLAHQYQGRLRALRGMLDELIVSISPNIPFKAVHWLTWLLLHRLYTSDETEEIRGISRVTGIDLYLLICLNTVLDVMMGCTSGGVRTKDSTGTLRMLHFRTLDWKMDPLRDLIVQLEFYRDSEPNKILATSITYVGFVGVLTGVREGLSVSLNFRPVHDTNRNLGFYFNHLLVLLGRRQSISSLLRKCILPSSENPPLATLNDIVNKVPGMPTTAAYLIFNDGSKTVTMEKDLGTAKVRSSDSFIVATNHDYEPDAETPGAIAQNRRHIHSGLSLIAPGAYSMADLVADSIERRGRMQGKWDQKLENMEASAWPCQVEGSRSSLRLRRKIAGDAEAEKAERERIPAFLPAYKSNLAITQHEAIAWLTTFPVVSQWTHYATLMDPTQGKPVWVRRYAAGECE